MSKKQTYAAVMKQLSNKKAQYEKGLAEAKRSNPQGVRDYERRLAKLNAGIDELFGAQQMANGGFTGNRYEPGGLTPGATNQLLPGSPAIPKDNRTPGMWGSGYSLIPWDGRPNALVDDNGNMVLANYKDGHYVMTPNLWKLRATNPAQFNKAMENPDTGVGQFKFKPEEYKLGTFAENGKFLPSADNADAVAATTAQTTVSAEAAGGTAETAAPVQTAPERDPLTRGGMGDLEFLQAMDQTMRNETQDVGGGVMFGSSVGPAPGAAPTAPVTAAADVASTVTGTAGLDAEQARRSAEAAALGMSGAGATTGVDPSVFGQGTQLPGLDTPGTGGLPGVFGIAESLGAFDAPAKTTAETIVDTPAADTPTTGDKLKTAGQKALGALGQGGGNPMTGLGMALGAAAQFIPDIKSLNTMRKLEGPVDAAYITPMAMNTDLQVGNQLRQIQDQAAISNANIDANIADARVSQALKRANQRVASQSAANVLANEAQQELNLRNENLRNLQNTAYQNQAIYAQNEQAQRDFANERMAAENRLRGQMSTKLGQAFGDFQNRAADLKKWDLVKKLDMYGVIDRNDINPVS